METNTTEQTNQTEQTAEKQPRKRKAKAAAPKNKKAQARSIFKSLARGKNGPNRARILERFMKDVGLSKAGASTYYQSIKKEFAESGSAKSKKAS